MRRQKNVLYKGLSEFFILPLCKPLHRFRGASSTTLINILYLVCLICSFHAILSKTPPGSSFIINWYDWYCASHLYLSKKALSVQLFLESIIIISLISVNLCRKIISVLFQFKIQRQRYPVSFINNPFTHNSSHPHRSRAS